jgi:hypothetical protein
MADYRFISADSHFVEPPKMWREHIDKKFRDRAPHTVKGLHGREESSLSAKTSPRSQSQGLLGQVCRQSSSPSTTRRGLSQPQRVCGTRRLGSRTRISTVCRRS